MVVMVSLCCVVASLQTSLLSSAPLAPRLTCPFSSCCALRAPMASTGKPRTHMVRSACTSDACVREGGRERGRERWTAYVCAR
eukprot:3764428-Pleurochrysis_carterae.AAC.1